MKHAEKRKDAILLFLISLTVIAGAVILIYCVSEEPNYRVKDVFIQEAKYNNYYTEKVTFEWKHSTESIPAGYNVIEKEYRVKVTKTAPEYEQFIIHLPMTEKTCQLYNPGTGKLLSTGEYNVVITTYARFEFNCTGYLGECMIDEISQDTEAYMVKVDMTAPSLPVNFNFDAPGKFEKAGLVYVRGDEINLKWDPGIDMHCDYPQDASPQYPLDYKSLLIYNLYHSLEDEIPFFSLDRSEEIDLLAAAYNEGYVNLYFTAQDHLGNKSEKSSPVRFYLDKTGPDDVTGIDAEIMSEEEAGRNYIKGIHLSWYEVLEDNPEDGSGVRGYAVTWIIDDNYDSAALKAALNDSPELILVESKSITYADIDFDDFKFDKGEYYYFAVRSIDNIQNRGNFIPSEKVYIPNDPIKIEQIINTDALVNQGTKQPVYKQQIKFNWNKNALYLPGTNDYSIAGIRINSDSGNVYEYTTDKIIDKSGNVKAPWRVIDTVNNKLALDIQLTGKQHAHKIYTYSVEIIHNNGGAVESGNEKAADYRLKNIVPGFPVIVEEEQGDFSGILDEKGYSAGAGELFELYTGKRVFFRVPAPNADGTDAEGDVLCYKLWHINKTELGMAWSDDGTRGIGLFPNQSDRYHCYISVEEYTENIGGTVKSLSDLYDSNLTRETLHKDDNNNDQGFFIYFDLKEGAGAFEVRANDYKRVLSETAPTGTTHVSIVIQPGGISDATGVVHSGIGAVFAWNVNTDEFERPEDLVAENLITNEPDDAQKINLGISSDPGDDAPEELFQLPWDLISLPPGVGEDIRAAGLKVVDGVGNEKFYLRMVKVDTLPPDPPAITGFSHSYTGDTIIVTWKAGETGQSYRVGYIPAQEEEVQYTEITKPQVTIPVSGYDSNQPVDLMVYAIDPAGNESDKATIYTPYTLAAPGTLEDGEQGYSEALGHYFTWTFSGGAASEFVLEQLDKDDHVIQSIPLGSGIVRHTKLTPTHGTFRYRQAAYNGNNVITYSPIFTRTLLNNPPGAPAEPLPAGYSKVDTKLSWKSSSDVDGDVITYSIYFREEIETVYQLLGKTDEIECVFPAGTTTLHLDEGKRYCFYIAADDSPLDNSYEGKSTVSETVCFEVDGTAPVITFTGLPAGAGSINNEELVVEVFDERSGVQGVWYWTSDGQGNEVNPIELEITGKGGGKYQARIPLHEGNYTVHVKARDNAGNEAEKATDGYYVDHKIPEIIAFTVNLPDAQAGNMGSTGEVPVRMTLRDNYSGIRGIHYGYSSVAGGVPGEWREVLLEPVDTGKEKDKEGNYIRNLWLDGEDGEIYYLVVRAFDWAGNYSIEYKINKGILLDTSGPVISLEVTGFHAANSRYYCSNIEQLSPGFTFEDNDSGIVSIHYTIKEQDQEENDIDWYTDYAMAREETLISGKSYSIMVKAVNGVGQYSAAESQEFVFDNTPALIHEVAGLPGRALVTGEEIRLFVKASDLDSALSEYAIAIGNKEDQTAFSGLVNGNENGWLKVKDSREEVCYQIIVPEITNGSYTVVLRVKNGSTMVSTLDPAGTIHVDNSQEKVLVDTKGMYSSSPDTLAARWEYRGQGTAGSYAYRIMNDQEVVLDWTATGADTAVVTGLNLVNGETYHFEVRAFFGGGTKVLTGESMGILVDYTVPLFAAENGIAAPLYCTSSGVWVSWHVFDDESGIGRIQVLLEKADDENNMIPVSGGWIDVIGTAKGEEVPVLTDTNGNPLDIVTGDKVYLTLKVMNMAGCERERAVPVITIDNTSPPVPMVMDSGEVINTKQYPAADWFWTKTDPESGTVQYKWTIVAGKDQIDTAEWYEDDGTREARVEEALGESFQRVHGDTWYFAVQAINGAGLKTTGMSNGILYDATAPLLAKVKLVRGPGNEELRYVEDFNGVNILIEASEDISLIDHYKAVYGYWDQAMEWAPSAGGTEYTSVGQRFSVSNPAPEVSEGKILVFRGMCINEATLISGYGYTRGTMVITRTPEIIKVRGKTSGTELFFDWEAEQIGVPVEGYNVELRTVGDGKVVYSAFTENNYLVIDAAAKNIGEGSYALYVKARSVIGLTSKEWGVSPVVVIDHTPAVIKVFTAPRYASHGISLYCEAVDDRSGIREYQYCAGTFENPVQFTGGWESVFTRKGAVVIQVDFEDLLPGIEGVLDGTAIYAGICVKNGTGLMSGDRMSDAIIIDKTPASTPLVGADNLFTRYKDQIRGISIHSTDNESGIIHYAWAVVNEKDSAALEGAEWHEVSTGTGVYSLVMEDMMLDNLDLGHGESCYAAVKTRNGAGDWSVAGMSPEIRVDLFAPGVEFTGGPGEIVLNTIPAGIQYQLVEDISPEVRITMTLELPTGASEEYPFVYLAPGVHTFVFDKNAYGTYILQMILMDNAGNESKAVRQAIRVNTPPEITLGNMETTPGKPLEFPAYVYDTDKPYTYSWDFGDGGFSTDPKPVHEYKHKEPYAQVSVYTVTLRVTDNFGKTGTAQAGVAVRNTVSGILYTDEYWSGAHEIRNDILIPVGVHLTVMSGADITVVGDPVDGYKHSLTVRGGMTVEQDARFETEQGVDELWSGIVVMGEADVRGAVITGAERGLAIDSSALVILEGTLFEHNEIGVHTLTSLAIKECTFTGNTLYGIKEDGGAEPAVLYCVFGDNIYDYYDDELTIISMETLNNKPGCTGNTKE